MHGCNDSRDLIIPKPDPSPLEEEVARLKRLVALRDRELELYREMVPGWQYSIRANCLIDIDGPLIHAGMWGD